MSSEKNEIIITGVNGFVGGHLAKSLKDAGMDIIGVGSEDEPSLNAEKYLSSYHKADLTETWPVEGFEGRGIIHLAGLAAVGPSYENPQMYIDKNSAMVTNLCEYYVKKGASKPRVLLVSSGAIYDPSEPMPITESAELGFNSPYAVSKVLNENQAKYYRGRGLDCVVVRPFNHIGPGQNEGFLLPDLYKKLSEAKENGETNIAVGNLDTRRDYTDVRDIVGAYTLLITASELQHDTYNVCSGESVSGKQIFELTKTAADCASIGAVVDEALIRPSDIPDIYGDSSRLRVELGWAPKHDLEQTVRDFVSSKASN